MPDDTSQINTTAYPQIVELAKRLIPIISQYDWESSARGVFCINSWYQNRSCQTCTMALNAALLNSKTCGEARVETYKEFENLLQEISQQCAIDYPEDEVLPVMGHVRIPFNGRWRKAILGCGMTQEYPRLCFADIVTKAAARTKEFESLLDYVESISDALNKGGWHYDSVGKDGLCLPPEEYWNSVNQWFDGFSDSLPMANVIASLSDEANNVENTHFLTRENSLFPVFNPSILTDYFGACCEEIDDEEYVDIADSCLITQALSAFYSEDGKESNCLLYPCFKADGALVEDCPGTLLLIDDKKGCTLFYSQAVGDRNIKRIVDYFEHQEDQFDVIEPPLQGFRRRGLTILKPKEMDFNLVTYHDDFAPLPTPVLRSSSTIADVTCSSLDLLAILQIADSIEEVNAFFHYLKTAPHTIHRLISSLSDVFISWKKNKRLFFPGAEDRNTVFNMFFDFNETDSYYCEFFSDYLKNYPLIDDAYLMGSPFSRNFRHQDRGFLEIQTKAAHEYLGITKCLGGVCPAFVRITIDFDSFSNLESDDLADEVETYRLVEDLLACLVNDLSEEMGAFCADCGGCVEFIYVSERSLDVHNFTDIYYETGLKGQYYEREQRVCFSVNRPKLYRALMKSSNRSIECDIVKGLISLIPKGTQGDKARLLESINNLRHQRKKHLLGNVNCHIGGVRTMSVPRRQKSRKCLLLKPWHILLTGIALFRGNILESQQMRFFAAFKTI